MKRCDAVLFVAGVEVVALSASFVSVTMGSWADRCSEEWETCSVWSEMCTAD